MSTIYLMRHSIAASGGFQTPDEARWLTEQGRDLAIEAAGHLGRHIGSHNQLALIVSSPLTRAVQTAELVSRVLDRNDEIPSFPQLRSEASPQDAVELVQTLAAESAQSAILVVCHEPIVSSMDSLLLGNIPSSAGPGFRPAEIHCLNERRCIWRH